MRDFTAYYATVPRDALEQVMAMEADRLQNLEINDAHAARELKVITEERNMRVENNAADLLGEQIDAITFMNHPYRQPLIGWAEDMATFTAADAKAFFKKYYRASNMVLVVAGDIDKGAVQRLAQHYYGGLPAGEAVTRHWPKEPPLRLTRHATMEDDKAREPRLLRQYVAPSVNDGVTDLAMPLALLSQYLGGSSTSLLYRSLVIEQKLASNVFASYDPLDIGPATLRIWAVPAQGVSLEQLEKALDDVLENALGQLPSDDDVLRAKTQLKAEVIYAQDGLEPLAQLMGQLYAIGKDEQYFYGWSDAVGAVRATDMLDAAQRVLNPSRRITGFLLPTHPMATDEATPPAAPAETEGMR